MAMPLWFGSSDRADHGTGRWWPARSRHSHDARDANDASSGTSPDVPISAADRVLLDRLMADDAEALDTLVRRYSTSLERYAFSLIRTPDLAADIVQDVFVRLWERRQSLDVHRSFASYLHRMVRHRALDLLRHEQVRERAEQAIRLDPDPERRSARNEGADRVDEAEFWTRVSAALDSLQPRCREIFQLHRDHGLSYAEIAAMLEISLPTVYNQMAKATKRLAEYLAM